MRLPAGKYYLGDPCYAFTNERWASIVDSIDALLHLMDAIIAFPTKHGDGVYSCELGDVLVDSGMIGLVPIEMSNRDTINNMYLISFDHEVTCENQNGKLIFGHIVIDTEDTAEQEDQESFDQNS